MKVIARLWESFDDKKVKCHVCANKCVIFPGNIGICRTRKNFDGKLFTLIYGSHISSGSLDPIEKKPLTISGRELLLTLLLPLDVLSNVKIVKIGQSPKQTPQIMERMVFMILKDLMDEECL